MTRDIIQKWDLRQPPDRVWECLTRQDLIAQWLMDNDFKPVVGHQFCFKTKPMVKMGFDGIVHCQVTEVTPLKRLSYTWKGGPGNGEINLDTIVTWTLTPTAYGTELILEHKGFKGFKNMIPYLVMGQGWRTKIRGRFTDLVNKQTHETVNS
jgi:uncharacterized protein YndB with AHSA1/START domain